jgi:hypothetical protein
MEEYRFDRLSKENLHNLVYLYRDCFNLKINLGFLEKKYDTISFGVKYIGFLAFEIKTNEPAGYYGVFPISGQINGNKILMAQSGDTMTHPKHQGKGLFTHLAKITYALAEKEGIDFIFGFPNKNSYPGFKKKLEWDFYNDINTYVIKTGTPPFDKLFKKLTFLKNSYNRYVARKLRALIIKDYFPNSIEKQNPELGYITHDQAFFNYKSYYEMHRIKINNVLCVIKIDGRLWVGDIEFCPKDQFFKTIEKLIELAKKLGCSALHFSVTNGTFYDKTLHEKYVVKSKNPVGFIGLGRGVDPSKFAYQAIDFDTY